MDSPARAKLGGMAASTLSAISPTLLWVVKSATQGSARSASAATWGAQSRASQSRPGSSASGTRSVIGSVSYLMSCRRSLNSGRSARSSHSKTTISVLTASIPARAMRASAASALAGARDPVASAAT